MPCRRIDTSPSSVCSYPTCNTQCLPWNGTMGWFRLGTGQCTPCLYDTSCCASEFSDMTTCGPNTAPKCTSCPGDLPLNALQWVNPGHIMTNPPCDIVCRNGYVKTANFTCIYFPNIPANAKVTGGCNWVCSLGFVQVGPSLCVPCTGVPTSCGAGTYLGYSDGSQCASCLPCTNLVSNAVYVSSGSDNGPNTCKVLCNPGMFIDPR